MQRKITAPAGRVASIVKDVPADRLRQLSLTTRIGDNPAQAELGDLSATLDQSKIAGGIVVASTINR